MFFSKVDFNEVTKQIEESFEKGPGDLPVKYRDKLIKGIIVPEGNYLISGGVAAWAYKEIAEAKFAELYILVGSCKGEKVYLSLEDFETPLGVVKNIGLNSKNENIVVDEERHAKEKGVEIQLPFLQYVSKDKLNQLRILPLLVGKEVSYETVRDVARAIKSVEKEFIIVVSSDITRYGERFGFVPFRFNIEQELSNLDMKTLELMQNLDGRGLFEFLEKTNISNGKGVCLLLEVLEENGRLLDYRSFGKSEIVSYASLVF